MGVERGHRTSVITRKGGKVMHHRTHPAHGAVIDLAICERCRGTGILVLHAAVGWTGTAPGGSSAG